MTGGVLETHVIYVDTFGNVKLTALAPALPEALGEVPFGTRLEIELRAARAPARPVSATWAETFGRVEPGTSATRKLTLRNKGQGVLRVVVGQLSTPFTVLGKRDFRLKPKETRVLQVRYTAPEGGGGAAATLTIGHSGKKSPVVVVPVSARGG